MRNILFRSNMYEKNDECVHVKILQIEQKKKSPFVAEREKLIVLVDNNGGLQHNQWKPKVHKHKSLPIME